MGSNGKFDPFSDQVLASGPDAYAELGKQCPIYHYRGRFDFFIANDASIVDSVLRDDDKWTTELGSGPKPQPSGLKTGIMTDPPHHLKVRLIIQKGFSNQDIDRLSAVVDRIADQLIDEMLADPAAGGDFFERFAMPLPARLMCAMIGAPEENYKLYKDRADEYLRILSNEPGEEADLTAGEALAEPFFNLLAERKAMLDGLGLKPELKLLGTALPNDFISRFLCETIDGQPLSTGEILSLMLGIIVGGNETTMNLIGSLLWSLLEKPERWETLKAHPELIEAAVEESLRLDPPVLGLFRNNRKEMNLFGEVLPAESKVMYNVAAVNRNPEIWPDPDEFRLDRPLPALRRHVSFSNGSHLCLGAKLTRMEVRRAFEKLVVRMPNLRIAGEAERIAPFNFWGARLLPVGWD